MLTLYREYRFGCVIVFPSVELSGKVCSGHCSECPCNYSTRRYWIFLSDIPRCFCAKRTTHSVRVCEALRWDFPTAPSPSTASATPPSFKEIAVAILPLSLILGKCTRCYNRIMYIAVLCGTNHAPCQSSLSHLKQTSCISCSRNKSGAIQSRSSGTTSSAEKSKGREATQATRQTQLKEQN